MTEQEFAAKAAETVKQIVDAIAGKEYERIASFAQIDSSWMKPGQTQEEAFQAFGEWLDGQLAMWAEDEEREFVVDHFDESCLDDIELEEDKSFVTYNPTNSGEELDFWFEIEFNMDKNEQISATFNVNI